MNSVDASNLINRPISYSLSIPSKPRRLSVRIADAQGRGRLVSERLGSEQHMVLVSSIVDQCGVFDYTIG
jgi:hypothetical protein